MLPSLGVFTLNPTVQNGDKKLQVHRQVLQTCNVDREHVDGECQTAIAKSALGEEMEERLTSGPVRGQNEASKGAPYASVCGQKRAERP